MAEHVTLVLKNDVAELDRVLNLVTDLCGRHSISEDMEYDLKLALDEVVSNVARHAYPAGEDHEFILDVTVDDDEFIAKVEDDGAAFNPMDHPEPNLDAPLEDRQEGGLGIFLVRNIMSSVEYQRIDGKNIITLRKRLAERAAQ